MRKNIILLAFSALVVSACTPDAAVNTFGAPDFLEGLYTTRPTVEEPTVTILKLKTPSLFESAEKKDGKLEIDPQQIKLIEAEQAATIAELEKISKDIRILIRYRAVLNGLAVYTPAEHLAKINSLQNVVMTEKAGAFERAQLATDPVTQRIGENTSVKFIGSEAAYEQNIKGQGMKVGIIDTGIDYTHKMFLGPGTPEVFMFVDPAKPHPLFPNEKVVGGIDLVGTDYNSNSPNPALRIPKPDPNPLDEGGHGTHVAGTVAGIGDGINTYSGVAPEADLYAIKVFGANGSTSADVVIAALEYAANPSGDGTFQDALDVVNLSLGSGYGSPHIMYGHAIKNLVRGGTIVVASGGNSGDSKYIVGAPGVSDDAISVASSIDNQNQNILVSAAEFKFGEETLLAEAVEGSLGKPLAEFSEMKGELIAAGLANVDFESPLKEQIRGRIALIDRGMVSFAEKVDRAFKAGAIAVIVANSVEGDPLGMSGDVAYPIPSVMISLKAGTELKEKLSQGVVIADLKSPQKVAKPEVVDTISPFSSRGPRSYDGLIKPEIAAPGTNIISAAMGSGDLGKPLSGTSMAGPHIAGVMALLKQKFPELNPIELKSVLLAHGKIIADRQKNTYTVSRQGAGRVQVANSLQAKLVTIPATLSFGLTDIEQQKVLSQKMRLKNISTETLNLTSAWNGSAAVKISAANLSLAPGEEKEIEVRAQIQAAKMEAPEQELDGYFTWKADGQNISQLPALIVARKISQVAAKSFVVHSSSAADSPGSLAEIQLANDGLHKGTGYLFNLLDVDLRKKGNREDIVNDLNCDIQSAGYRVIEKNNTRVLQVAVKLYEGVSTWNTCEVNVQIDGDGDNLTDQEIAGITEDSLPGLTASNFISLLLDGKKARQIRKSFEEAFKKDPSLEEDYSTAVVDKRAFKKFDNSTLAILEADVSLLALAPTGELNIKVSSTHQASGAVEYDDYLAQQGTSWKKISLRPMGQAFVNLPEAVPLEGKKTITIPFSTGYGAEPLVLYTPENRAVRDALWEDSQSQILSPTYGLKD